MRWERLFTLFVTLQMQQLCYGQWWGRETLMIFSAVLTIHCRVLWCSFYTRQWDRWSGCFLCPPVESVGMQGNVIMCTPKNIWFSPQFRHWCTLITTGSHILYYITIRRQIVLSAPPSPSMQAHHGCWWSPLLDDVIWAMLHSHESATRSWGALAFNMEVILEILTDIDISSGSPRSSSRGFCSSPAFQ